MYPNIFERRLLEEEIGFKQREVKPVPDNFFSLRSETAWEVFLEELSIPEVS